MNLKLVILTISLVQCNIIFADCKIHHTLYNNYINEVLDHMCNQNGWKSFEKIYLNFDSVATFSVPELMTQKLDRYSIFYCIVHILNYRFNEILLNLKELLNIVVDICFHYFNTESIEDFYNCSSLLGKTIKNSLSMFESLYNAITFVSYIDLILRKYKIVIAELQCNPFITVDNIYDIKNHRYLQKKQNENLNSNLHEFLDIKEFIDDISKIANNFFENNTSITNNNQKVDFKSLYEKEYSSYTQDYTNFVTFMIDKIDSFYVDTIKNNYENLGFIQLINPTELKFKPPRDYTVNQELGIAKLNTLLDNGSWESFSHINIQYDGLKISAKHVIRDLATDLNFHLKKDYFTQMIRCKFFEVLLNYNTLLSALKQVCTTLKDENNYVKCVTCLFDAINDTAKMFDFMLTIIEKLKLSSIWIYSRSFSDLYSTHNLIYNYVIQLRTHNVVRDKFVNNPKVNTKKLATDYIINFENARSYFAKLLLSLKHQSKNRCYLDGLITTKEQIIIKFKDNVNCINKRSDETHVTEYELITNYLIMYCRHFIKTDYMDTGFDKIHLVYFWRWI